MAESDNDHNEQLMFSNLEHQTSLLQCMKSMYDDCQLIDVQLQIDEQTFDCHKNVLAATSPYFRAMFTTELRESKCSHVQLHEVDAECVQLIIDYAYTGELIINRGNAQNLLVAASLYQITAVKEACAKFMESQLDVSNCVGIHFFALIHYCQELSEKAKECIEKHFTDIYNEEEFLLLSSENVASLLSSNELNVESEELVFAALMKWVLYDTEERVNSIYSLLKQIRFALLPSRFIQDCVVPNSLISSNAMCCELLKDLKQFEINPDTYLGSHEFSVILRSGMIKPEHCILFIGGICQRTGKPLINCYNPLTRETYFLADLHRGNRACLGYYDIEDPACVVTEDNQIFVAGGNYVYHVSFMDLMSEGSCDDSDDESVHKDLFQYDNDHDTWKSRAPMLFPKSNFALASFEGSIYCFGGLTVKQHPIEIVERYDIALNRWNYVGIMPTTIVDLSTVVHAGLIYVLGGRTGVGAHNVVMSFSPRTNEWKSLAGMPTPRFKFGASVYDNEIYVAGGQIYSHNSHTISREALSSVEIYSILKNQWRQGPELPEDMYNVGLFLLNGSLYAAGSTEYHRSAYHVYRYNVVYKLSLANSKWEQIETDLCDIREFGCVAAKMQTRKLPQVFRPDVDT